MAHITFTQGESAPNWLGSEVGKTLKTRQFLQTMGQIRGARRIVPSGTIFPANDSTAEGIVFGDIDVTTGDVEGAVMIAGRVLEDRLPIAPGEEAKTAMEKNGIHFDAAPDERRPY